MFAHTIRLQKRAHTEGSKRGKSSPQPRSADPSLREETGGINNTTAPDIVPSCRSAASDNLPPTAARFVAEARFALESGSVTSRSVGSRCCQVALLFGQSRGGDRSVQRRWGVLVVLVLEGESFLRLPLGSGKSFPSGAASISRRRGIVTEWRPQPEDGSSVRCHTAGEDARGKLTQRRPSLAVVCVNL